MKKRNLTSLLSVGLPMGLCLAFSSVGCSSDSSSNSNSGGTSATSTGGSSSTAGKSGGSSKSGSSSTGGGSSSSGDVGSGLPADKPVSDLTADEAAALCSQWNDMFSKGPLADKLKDVDCRLAGMLGAAFSGKTADADLQAACTAAYDECEKAPAKTTQTCDAEKASTCMATVAELQACADDSAAALTQALDSLPACDKLTAAGLMGMDGDTPMETAPASCQVVSDKCPDAVMTSASM